LYTFVERVSVVGIYDTVLTFHLTVS